MLILSPEEARPGMSLAAAVPHPDNPEQILLKSGYVLEETVIGRLRDMRIDQVFVDYPALHDLDRHLAPHLSPARRKIYLQIRNVVTAMQQSTRAAVPYADYCAATRELITTLLDQGQHPIFLDQMARLGGDCVGHAAAVAHLSLLLGLRLEPYLIEQRKRLPPHQARDVVNLGIAAMFHDIGKCALITALRAHNETDLPGESSQIEQWQSHCQIGYEMVRQTLEPSAAAAVLHHHQNYDGTGFPKLAGRENRSPSRSAIHVFARIIHAANLYDRLATGAPDRRRSNIEILHLMRTEYAGRIDPEILRTLQAIAPPFPPGAKLSLTDGTDAVVVHVDQADPYFPVVRRLIGTEMKLDQKPIDLRDYDAPSVGRIGSTQVAPFMPMRSLSDAICA